jgi:hypothetical protein
MPYRHWCLLLLEAAAPVAIASPKPEQATVQPPAAVLIRRPCCAAGGPHSSSTWQPAALILAPLKQPGLKALAKLSSCSQLQLVKGTPWHAPPAWSSQQRPHLTSSAFCPKCYALCSSAGPQGHGPWWLLYSRANTRPSACCLAGSPPLPSHSQPMHGRSQAALSRPA